MKAKKVLAMGLAVMIGTATVASGTQFSVMAQENVEKEQTVVTDNNVAEQQKLKDEKGEETQSALKNLEAEQEKTENKVDSEVVKPEKENVKVEGIALDEAHFPDESFRGEISKKVDKNQDGVLSNEEIKSLNTLRITDAGVKNIKGIEYFTEVTDLTIKKTSLSSLKLTGLGKLKFASIESNLKLTSIDISNHKTISKISYYANPKLKTLDFRGCNNLKIGWHSDNQETVYLSAGMTQYIGCDVVKEHTGNIVIDLDNLYTINPDGSKSVDLSKIISSKLISVLAKEKHPSFNEKTNILTIPAGEKTTVLQAGRDNSGKPTRWTFHTDIVAVNDCTVKFNSMGGSLVEDEIVENGKMVKKPQDPVKEGFVFKGWYTEKDYKNQYDFSSAVLNDITLYAKWEKANNEVPVINANNLVLTVGDSFDPLAKVTAQDKEDGAIKLTKENVIANDVNTSKVGIYHVTYKVADSNGAIAEKTITVTVKEKEVSSVPKTGDLSAIGGLGSMLVGSSGTLAVLLGKRRKKK
ncbi:InlB B-repeat-containing protein [Faecalimonas sp.]